jgi:hypothetical protein
LTGSGSNVEPGSFLWRQFISFVKIDQRIFLRIWRMPGVFTSMRGINFAGSQIPEQFRSNGHAVLVNGLPASFFACYQLSASWKI